MTKALNFIDRYVLCFSTFKILILLVLFAFQIPFVHYAFGGFIKYILLFGLITCAWNILKKHNFGIIKDIPSILLFAFSLFYLFTIFANRETCFSDNIKQLVYMVVFFWAFFVSVRDQAYQSVLIDIKKISITIVVITFILSFVSFLTYSLNIFEWYIIEETSMFNSIGTLYGKLIGLYNSNSCGAIALISLIASIFLMFESKLSNKVLHYIKLVVLILNAVLQFVVMVLSQSRGAYFTFLIVVFLLVFLLIVKSKKQKAFIRVLMAMLISVLLLFLIVKISSFIQINAEKFIVVSNEDSTNVMKDTRFENAIEDLLKRYFEDSSANYGVFKLNTFSSSSYKLEDGSANIVSTTGRSVLWKAGFEVFLKNPILGVSREGLVQEVNNVLGYESDPLIAGGLHNMYLTILVSSGVVGFLIIGSAFIIVFYKFLRVLLSEKSIDIYLLFSFAMVLAFMISELVENRVLYQVTVFNAAFWIYFGYFYYFVKTEYDDLKTIQN